MIRRVDKGRNHWYEDEDTGARVPGVTSRTGDGVPKPKLINWSANATAEYAVDNWDRLAELAPSARLKELQGGRYAVTNKAKNKGTQVHKLAERLVTGEQVAIPDGLEGYVEAYVRFLDEFDVRPVLIERTVYSAQHNYCGTFDLIAELLDPNDAEPNPEAGRRQTWLLDIKTGEKGVFGETALQLAAYRYADVWIDQDQGAEYEMPQVDLCGAVHLSPDRYQLLPVEAGPMQHRQFLYAAEIAEFLAHDRDLIGEPIASPHTSTYRLIREET